MVVVVVVVWILLKTAKSKLLTPAATDTEYCAASRNLVVNKIDQARVENEESSGDPPSP